MDGSKQPVCEWQPHDETGRLKGQLFAVVLLVLSRQILFGGFGSFPKKIYPATP